MKILCLHGAYGNIEVFQSQLTPFLQAVGGIDNLEFKWINGAHVATPPDGYDAYFGTREVYRHVNFDGISALDDILSSIRDMPDGDSAEESIRRLTVGHTWSSKQINATLDRLFQIIDDDPEIDGILGYSEGASVAATLLLEQQRRCERGERLQRLKMGIFFAGWPPVIIRGDTAEPVLADEDDTLLQVPSLHIVGSKDPYIHGAMALFNICDPDAAILFDHGKGHTVPRDAKTMEELSLAVTGALSLAGCAR